MNRKFFSDAIWIIVGRIGIGIALILTTRVLTEQVSPAEYGFLALMISLSGLAFNIAFQPVNQASQRFIPSALNDHTDAGVRAALLKLMRRRYVVAASIVCVGYAGLSSLDMVPMRWPMLIGVLLLTLVTGYRSLLTFMLEAVRNQKLSSIWKLVEVFLKIAFAVSVMFLIGPSAEAILIGFFLGFGVPSAFFVWRHRESQFSVDPAQDHRRAEISRFAIPLAFAGALSWFIGFSDRFVLSAFGDAERVGIYYAVYGLMSFPLLQLGGIFSTLFQPIFFRHENAMRHNLILWIGALAILLTPVLLFIGFYSNLIAQLLLGEAFRGGADFMIWIAAGYGLLSLNMALDAKILANQRTRLLTMIMLVAAVSNLGLNLLLIPELGAEGAAISTFLTFSIQLTLSFIAAAFVSWQARARNARAKVL